MAVYVIWRSEQALIKGLQDASVMEDVCAPTTSSTSPIELVLEADFESSQTLGMGFTGITHHKAGNTLVAGCFDMFTPCSNLKAFVYGAQLQMRLKTVLLMLETSLG